MRLTDEWGEWEEETKESGAKVRVLLSPSPAFVASLPPPPPPGPDWKAEWGNTSTPMEKLSVLARRLGLE